MSWLSAVAGLAGTLYQNSQNQASAQASMNFQREVLQNRNQWAVEDLKKAGLNPILAAGATQSSAAGAQASNENPVSGAVSSAAQAAAMKIAQREQANRDKIAESQVNLNSAKATKELAEATDYGDKREANYYGVQADSLGASADFNRANAQHLIKLGAKIDNDIEIGKAEIARMEKERDLLVERVRTEKTVQGRNNAAAELDRMEKGLVVARTDLTKAEEAGQQVENRLKNLKVPIAEIRAKQESEGFGGDHFSAKFNRGFRNLVDTINPFSGFSK